MLWRLRRNNPLFSGVYWNVIEPRAMRRICLETDKAVEMNKSPCVRRAFIQDVEFNALSAGFRGCLCSALSVGRTLPVAAGRGVSCQPGSCPPFRAIAVGNLPTVLPGWRNGLTGFPPGALAGLPYPASAAGGGRFAPAGFHLPGSWGGVPRLASLHREFGPAGAPG